MSILKLAQTLMNGRNGTPIVSDEMTLAANALDDLANAQREFAAQKERSRQLELETLQAALNQARERAEDAETDRDEARVEALGIGRELIEAQDKIAALENVAAIESHKLTDAYRQIEALRKYNAAQKTVIEELRAKLLPLEGSSPTFSPRRNKPGISAIPGPDPSDADPHLADPAPAQLPAVATIAADLVSAMAAAPEAPVRKPRTAPRQPVHATRQRWHAATRTWQPA